MDAVCFDMDGVIVDSERHWVPLENEQILPGAVASDGVTADEITGMNVNDLYTYLADEYGTNLSRGEFIALYDEVAEELYSERVALMDGFEALVQQLRARDISTAVASSSPHRWIDLVLDRFSLEWAFDTVVSAEDIGVPGKPAPHIYEQTVAKLGVETSQGIAVEDSTHGIAAANRAGMYSLGYQTDNNSNQDLSAANEVVKGSPQLRNRLEDLVSPS